MWYIDSDESESKINKVMKQRLAVCFFMLGITISCGVDKNSPKYITEQYLLALKEKNWEKAKIYTDDTGVSNINCMKEMNQDMGLTDVKNIKCEIKNEKAVCSFCCMKNDTNPSINLRKINDIWKVLGVKETCPLSDSGYIKAQEMQVDSLE